MSTYEAGFAQGEKESFDARKAGIRLAPPDRPAKTEFEKGLFAALFARSKEWSRMKNNRKPLNQPLTLKHIYGRCRGMGECKIWTGALSKNGHPYIHDPSKYVKRLGTGTGGSLRSGRPVVFKLKYKKEPQGPIVMTCGNKLCLNPAHMKDVTRSVMLKDYGNLRTTRRNIACKSNMLKAAKLDFEKAQIIRETLAPYKGQKNRARAEAMRELARQFGVSVSCINNVRVGDSWCKPHVVPMSSVWTMGASSLMAA